MSDSELLIEIVGQILEGIRRIERRFQGIESANDFLKDDDGLDRLDAIGMMLIAIGESLKIFERSGGQTLLERHTEVDWKGAKGIRDFLSHQYFDLDTEIVFKVCTERIAGLKETIRKIGEELDHGAAS